MSLPSYTAFFVVFIGMSYCLPSGSCQDNAAPWGPAWLAKSKEQYDAAVKEHPERYLPELLEVNEKPDGGVIRFPLNLPGDFMRLIRTDTKSALTKDEQRTVSKLRASKVPNTTEASRFAQKAIGFDLAMSEVIELVRCGISIPSFAERGDLIWVVRHTNGDLKFDQEAWVSSTTAQVRLARKKHVCNSHGDEAYDPLARSINGLLAHKDDNRPLPIAKPETYRDFSISKAPYIASDHLGLFRGEERVQLYAQRNDRPEAVKAFMIDLLASKVPSPKAAVELTTKLFVKDSNEKKNAVAIVVGLALMGIGSDEDPTYDRLEDGDPIWLVRFKNCENEVVQQAYVNAITGKIEWIFPMDAPKPADSGKK